MSLNSGDVDGFSIFLVHMASVNLTVDMGGGSFELVSPNKW